MVPLEEGLREGGGETERESGRGEGCREREREGEREREREGEKETKYAKYGRNKSKLAECMYNALHMYIQRTV